MEIIVFEKEAYYKMMGEMMSMFKNAVKEVQKEFHENIDWINPEEAMQLLNIMGKTRMQELRNNGDIVYSKYGKKIKYSKKSILALIDKNKRSF